MHPDDRNGSQGATIIQLVRLRFGQEAGIPAKPPHLLDQVRESLRARHYSPRTEKAYCGWIHRYILFHGDRRPEDMAEAEIGAYLSNLAEAKVSSSTQNQALAALLFLYQEVLGRQLAWLGNLVHAKRPKHVPVVLARDEVRAVLARLRGPVWLVCALLYGAGLRLLEAAVSRAPNSLSLGDYGTFVDFFREQVGLDQRAMASTFVWLNHRYFLRMFGGKRSANRRLRNLRLGDQDDKDN